MSFTARELGVVIHGVGLGGLFLLSVTGGLVDLWSLRAEWTTLAGIQAQLRRLIAGTWIAAIVVWLPVMTSTSIVYP